MAFRHRLTGGTAMLYLEVQLATITGNVLDDILGIVYFIVGQRDDSSILQNLKDFNGVTGVFKALLNLGLRFSPMRVVDISMDTSGSIEIKFLKNNCRNGFAVDEKLDRIYTISETAGAMPVDGIDTQTKLSVYLNGSCLRKRVYATTDCLYLKGAARCMLVKQLVVEVVDHDVVDRRVKAVGEA